jgi:integrase
MRQPKPFFRKFTNSYYVQLGKKQVKLADGPQSPQNEAKAYQEYYRLMAEQAGAPVKDVLPKATVRRLCDLFLTSVCPYEGEPPKKMPARKAPQPPLKENASHGVRTYWWYREYLQSFCDAVGKLPVAELKPLHVNRWLDQHPDWKAGRRCAVIAVKRVFNWAHGEGLIESNPLRKLKKPAAKARDRILTPDEKAAILANYDQADPFFDFLTALFETGARPGEVSTVTAANVSLAEGVWEFQTHKTSKRLKEPKPRVVVLTPRALELTRKLVALRPSGPLFLDTKGEPWNRNSIRCRFRRVRKKLGLGGDVVAYTSRHTFATDALEKGVPEASVAELLGHADTTMLFRHYAKLSKKREHLREMARKAAEG